MNILRLVMLVGISCVATDLKAAESGIVTIDSTVTEQQLNIKVLLPDSYEKNAHSGSTEVRRRYPVFYTTSGDRRLAMLTSQLDWLSHVQFAPFFECIVVVLPDVEPDGKLDKFAKADGSVTSLAIEVYQKDVIPYIDKHYRTEPFRLIEGFSSNANQVLSIFLKQPLLFNIYMAFSPALELDNSGIIEQFTHLKLTPDYQYRSLYLNLGSFAENRPYFEQLQKVFTEKLHGKQPGLVTYAEDLSQHNYLSGPVVGLVEAAEKLLADRFPPIEQFEQSGSKGIKHYFAQLKKKYGFDIDTQNSLIDLAYFYLSLKRFNDAQNVMTALLKEEPKSIFLHTRLADVQKQSGNKSRALDTLLQGLDLAKQADNTEAVTYIQARINALR